MYFPLYIMRYFLSIVPLHQLATSHPDHTRFRTLNEIPDQFNLPSDIISLLCFLTVDQYHYTPLSIMHFHIFAVSILYGLTLAAPVFEAASSTEGAIPSSAFDADAGDLDFLDTPYLEKRYHGSPGHKIACWLKCHMPGAEEYCPPECT